MRAIVNKKYGSPENLKLEEVPKPIPKPNEVLIKIINTTVSAGDCEVRKMKMPILFWLPIRLYMGLLKPRINILGQELSGVIEAVGSDVTNFSLGDEVLAATEMNLGAYAEYIVLPADGAIAIKPAEISFEQAASLPVGSINAVYFLQSIKINHNQKILINGAGGSIGTLAIQIAKSQNAEVTAVDKNEKLQRLKEIGADRVIDYNSEDVTKINETFDVIFEVSGKLSYSRCKNLLGTNGIFISANPTLLLMVQKIWTTRKRGKKVITGVADNNKEYLNQIIKLVKEGKVKPVIDKSYPLDKIAEAHRYVESESKIGNVIINVTSK